MIPAAIVGAAPAGVLVPVAARASVGSRVIVMAEPLSSVVAKVTIGAPLMVGFAPVNSGGLAPLVGTPWARARGMTATRRRTRGDVVVFILKFVWCFVLLRGLVRCCLRVWRVCRD